MSPSVLNDLPSGSIPPGFEGTARIESKRPTGVKGTAAGVNLPLTNAVNPTEANSDSFPFWF